MTARIWISEIIFSDDYKIEFSKNDITVFVGPNNAGKSATLKESAKLLRQKADKGKVLKDLTIEKTGEEGELFDLLESISMKNFLGTQNLIIKDSNTPYTIKMSNITGLIIKMELGSYFHFL